MLHIYLNEYFYLAVIIEILLSFAKQLLLGERRIFGQFFNLSRSHDLSIPRDYYGAKK